MGNNVINFLECKLKKMQQPGQKLARHEEFGLVLIIDFKSYAKLATVTDGSVHLNVRIKELEILE